VIVLAIDDQGLNFLACLAEGGKANQPIDDKRRNDATKHK
jgi:hypothetical protein